MSGTYVCGLGLHYGRREPLIDGCYLVEQGLVFDQRPDRESSHWDGSLTLRKDPSR